MTLNLVIRNLVRLLSSYRMNYVTYYSNNYDLVNYNDQLVNDVISLNFKQKTTKINVTPWSKQVS